MIKEYWKYIAVFVLGGVLGFYVCHTWFPRIETKEVEKVKVETKVEYKDRTVVQYVPKTSAKDSDVEINKELPKITTSFNGQQHTFEGVQDEVQKFDKGKLVVDQSSTLKVDVSAEVQKQVEQGINKAFADQAKKAKIRTGVEVSIDSDRKTEVNARVSRQSQIFDVDLRANQKKQSISVTWWL